MRGTLFLGAQGVLPTVWFALCMAGLLMLAVPARAEVPVPALAGPVVDTTNTLQAAQLQSLAQTLQTFEEQKGSQVAVLLVQTTQPETIEQYSLRVAEAWKIGRKQVDDGAIVVLALQDRALRIEVGYGLEGVLTDIASKRIIEDIMVPRLRAGDVHGALQAGTQAIMRLVEGEPLPAPNATRQASTPNALEEFGPLLFFVAIAVGGALRKAMGRLPAAMAVGAGVSVLAWFLSGAVLIALLAGVAALLLTLFNQGGGGLGTVYGGRRGGFGGGFGGGGGFRGGGGGFGGGGASGRW
ncbi:YgcG family protein [Limnobacter sp.]|uniref:TPM domain-containing protein n=1 Tax=Limnobacter sp. TaxID=2003368 RepID=UPI0035173F3A